MPADALPSPLVELRVCIDVPDLQRGLDFYTAALGLTLGRRKGDAWAEVLGASAPLDLLANAAGTEATSAAGALRDYGRHWTPVHLDVVVLDLDAALRRALAAGATLDRAVQVRPWGRMANVADPFGNGFCLLAFEGKGYDAELSPT
jgi:catechol 2,3-dioxygenase-like lactoylglutathione lyase family enzyme